MLVGEIDSVPGEGEGQAHKVATRFFSFVGPLIPFESMCVTHEHFEHYGRRTTHSYSGEPVRLNPLSIVLGYLRVWLGVAVFALPFVLYWGQAVKASMFIPSAWALGALLVVAFVPGLLARERRRKLAVLRRVVGLGCDPAFRFPYVRGEVKDTLAARLAEAQLPTSAQAVLDRVPSLGRPELELVFATAWYQRACGERDWDAVMRAAWARL